MTLTLAKQAEDFRFVHRIADPEIPRFAERLRRMLARLANQQDLAPVFSALDADQPAEAIQVLLSLGDVIEVPDELADELVDTLTEIVTRTAAQTALETSLAFDLVNPKAVAWARSHAADLVAGFDQQLRRWLRGLVVKALQDGIPPRSLARMIRSSVGLSPRLAAAVERYRAGFDPDTSTVAVADRLTDRYAARLLRFRAETIARTETMRAANEGQRIVWETFADRTGADVRKVWIASMDERLCKRCAVMEGVTVGIRERFTLTERAKSFRIVSRTGPRRIEVLGTVPLKEPISVQAPPLHPRDRCTIGFVEG